MITYITYLSEYKASQLDPNSETALISIADPGHAPPGIFPQGWGMFYQDFFIDGDYDADLIRTFGEHFHESFSGYMQKEQASQMKAFVHDVLNNPEIEHLVVHCTAGRSRSAAVAQYASDITEIVPVGDFGISGMNTMVYKMLHNPGMFSELTAQPPSNDEPQPRYAHLLQKMLTRLFR